MHKPTLDQIKKFCAVHDLRVWLLQPHREGDYIVACNGHIAIRVPACDEFAAIEPCADPNKKNSFSEVIQQACDTSSPLLPTPELPPADPCQHCGGSGKAYKCTSCDGEGEFDHDGHEYECKACEHTGQVEQGSYSAGAEEPCQECSGSGEKFAQPVQVGNAHYQRRYLALVASLGNGMIAPAGNGIAYWKADGCDGAIMPTRV